MRGTWTEPLEVEVGRIGSYRIVSDTAEAAILLLNDFPLNNTRGKAYGEAKEACLSVLGGLLEPDEARAAFIVAAREAGMTIRPRKRFIAKGRVGGTRWGPRAPEAKTQI